MWEAVAPAWGAHADYIDARAAGLTAALLEACRLHTGGRVLELACGAGGAGITAAALVAPGGEVLLSDVSEQMVAIAAARASARGVTNARARRIDAEDIDEPDGSFDAVLCREGLMFTVDPARAVAQIHRVLRPGGRVAAAVWGPPAANPWMRLVLETVAAELGAPAAPPGMPGPFSLSDADGLATLFTSAGFADVAVREHPVDLRSPSVDDWFSRTAELAGPLAKKLPGLPAERRQAIRDRLAERAQPYVTPDGVVLPGLSLVATAQKPA
jgi:SAM-dependent methyltransferase